MRIPISLAAVLALAACGPAAQTDSGNRSVATEEQNPATLGAATSAAEGAALAEQEQAAGDLAWTGEFAASPELCTGGAWKLGETRIVTDGHTACDVKAVTRDPGRVTLALACTAEGTLSNELWALTRNGESGISVARTAGTETVNVDLVRCG